MKDTHDPPQVTPLLPDLRSLPTRLEALSPRLRLGTVTMMLLSGFMMAYVMFVSRLLPGELFGDTQAVRLTALASLGALIAQYLARNVDRPETQSLAAISRAVRQLRGAGGGELMAFVISVAPGLALMAGMHTPAGTALLAAGLILAHIYMYRCLRVVTLVLPPRPPKRMRARTPVPSTPA